MWPQHIASAANKVSTLCKEQFRRAGVHECSFRLQTNDRELIVHCQYQNQNSFVYI